MRASCCAPAAPSPSPLAWTMPCARAAVRLAGLACLLGRSQGRRDAVGPFVRVMAGASGGASDDGSGGGSAGLSAAEEAAAEEGSFEGVVAVDTAATESRDLARGVEAGDGLAVRGEGA